MQRSRVVRTAVSLTALTLVAAGGAWALDRGRPGPGTPGGSTGPTVAPRVDLAAYRSFGSCDELLGHLRSQALPLVSPFGLGDERRAVPQMAPGVARASGEKSAVGADASGSTSDTGTNVQVAGVDEADVTKKVGDLVLTVAAGEGAGLTVLRTGDRQVRVVGRLATGWRPEQLLVHGSRVLLLGPVQELQPGVPSDPAMDGARTIKMPVEPLRTRVAEVDVTDPARPRLVRTLDLDGRLVGARLAGGVLRLSVTGAPSHLPFVTPGQAAYGGGPQSDVTLKKALDANQRVVRTSPIGDWLPRYTLTPAGGKPSTGALLECERVGVPSEFSGLGTLAMLTFDLRSGGIDRWEGGGVVASGSTLYSNGDRTYVTTQPWSRLPVRPLRGTDVLPGRIAGDVARVPQDRTVVHAFATAASGVQYLGSGSVDGTLLGQYAMDEYDGRLRVATTMRPRITDPVGPPTLEDSAEEFPGDPGIAPDSPVGKPVPVPRRSVRPTRTSSAVTVLQLRDGRLERVGRVDGLGPDEVIHGVRFAGPQAYVVTFRQTDPLYVVDLADPAHPKVTGELKVLGYSAYLHPLGDGLLLGIGQDATADGQRTGLLMSLFDVSDAAKPRLLDRVSIPGAWPLAESDAHAFTHADGLVLTPVQAPLAGSASGPVDGGVGEGAVLAVRVEGRRLSAPTLLRTAGTRSAPGMDAMNLRTFVADGAIWSVAPGSPRPVAAVHDASTLRWLSVSTF